MSETSEKFNDRSLVKEWTIGAAPLIATLVIGLGYLGYVYATNGFTEDASFENLYTNTARALER